MNELDNRITELEIRIAFQDELLTDLNDTIAKMRENIGFATSPITLSL